MKIAYCISALNHQAGMERIIIDKVNWLSRHGYDMTIIVGNSAPETMPFDIDPAVNLVYFGIEGTLSFEIPFLDPVLKEYRARLSEHLNAVHYDIVVSTGVADSHVLYKIKDGSRKVVEYHFALHHEEYFRKAYHQNLIYRLKGKLLTWCTIANGRRYDRVVVLTDGDYNEWRRYTRHVVKISNTSLINPSQVSTCDSHEVIAVGRLSAQKGFDYLIDAWAIVAQRHPDWNLSIYGCDNGEDNARVQAMYDKIDALQLSRDIIKGSTDNIVQRYIDSSIMVSSSRYEGFSLVLLEAGLCGLPLIAYDCPHGPSEIVDNGVNGILIPKVGDIQALADAICHLIENEPLRKQMGQQALHLKSRFSPDIIMPQWEHLFNSLLSQK